MLIFLHTYIFVHPSYSSALVHRIQVQEYGGMPPAQSHVYRGRKPEDLGLLETAGPPCTVTLREIRKLLSQHTVLRNEPSPTFYRVSFGCRAYQQFIVGDLLVRSVTVTHCNTQYTSNCEIHCSTLPILQNGNMRFGSTHQGKNIYCMFLAGDQSQDTTIYMHTDMKYSVYIEFPSNYAFLCDEGKQ